MFLQRTISVCTFNMRCVGVAIVVVSAYGQHCPGSPSTPHAQCSVEAQIAADCVDVRSEILARIVGNAAGSWVDPHNGGMYSLLSSDHAEVISVQRVTGTGEPCCPGPYTDLIDFTLKNSNGGCVLSACSESQSPSVSDGSTNYCNQRNLYCGTEVGCTPVKHNFAFNDHVTYLSPGTDKYPGASANASKCIVTEKIV